jgi:hypothetical protein
VPPAPLAIGCVFGSVGSVTVYVMSLPEPGIPDLNNTDGSSCPTYSPGGLSTRCYLTSLSQTPSAAALFPAYGSLLCCGEPG